MTLTELDEPSSSVAPPNPPAQEPAAVGYHQDPGGRVRRLGRSARTWVVIPLVLGLGGFAAGAAAGQVARPNAQALVRVEAGQADATTADVATKSAVVELDTQRVLAA